MRTLVLAAAFLSLGVIAAGCAGSHSVGIANLTTTSNGTTTSGATAGAPSSGDAVGSPSAEANSSGTSGKTGPAFSVTGTLQEMTKFAACMRAIGEPTFPDPNAQGVISAGSLNRSSPQFQRALDSCRKDTPNGTPSAAQRAQHLQQAVAASACMRRNGVPNFPDPQTGPSGTAVIHLASNTDPSSPQFQHAQRVCQKEGHDRKG